MTKITLPRGDKSKARLLRWMRAVLAPVFVMFLLYRWSGKREPESRVVPATKPEIQSAISKWFSGIAGDGVTDCDTVEEYVESGQWMDPNQGHVYLRKVKTKPHFYVSVHNQQYDVVRWQNIFEQGDDNEHKVRKNFEYILGEANAQWNSNSKTLPVVVDIGGNVGYFTLLSAAWQHAVVTFEINPTNVIRLCESVRFNPEPMHVRIQRRGVSEFSGMNVEMTFPMDPWSTSLEKGSKAGSWEHRTSSARKFSVSTITLDDFAMERNWFGRRDLHISALKLDTNGHEPQVLEGAKKFIRHHLAKNWMIEFSATCRDAVTLLLDSGYVIVDDAVHAKRLLSRKESEIVLDALAAKNHVTNLWFRLSNMSLT